MLRMFIIIVILFAYSSVYAQPPIGTGRVIERANGRIDYYTSGGKWLGQSISTAPSYTNYYDNRGLYSQTFRSGFSLKQGFGRGIALQKPKYSVQPRLTNPSRHVIVSPPGSSVYGPGHYRSK